MGGIASTGSASSHNYIELQNSNENNIIESQAIVSAGYWSNGKTMVLEPVCVDPNIPQPALDQDKPLVPSTTYFDASVNQENPYYNAGDKKPGQGASHQREAQLSQSQLRKLANDYHMGTLTDRQVAERLIKHGNTIEQWDKADAEYLDEPAIGENWSGTNRQWFEQRLTGPDLSVAAENVCGALIQAIVLKATDDPDKADAAGAFAGGLCHGIEKAADSSPGDINSLE
jgi:hypothetical protein